MNHPIQKQSRSRTLFAWISFVSIFLLQMNAAQSSILPINNKNNDVLGETFQVSGQQGDNLADIGRDYDIGGYQMLEANPGINKRDKNQSLLDITLKQDMDVTIPGQFILPNVERKGIVINLSELRLYYFPPDGSSVVTFPVGIGRQGWKTPIIKTYVTRKEANPVWDVPHSIQEYEAKKGIYLPHEIGPGPKDPLGKYALHLQGPDILIHGTNAPDSVGWRVSSGCIRMLADHIKYLFENVAVHTPVNIIDEPYKVGFLDGKIYLEAHKPVQENPARDDTSYKYVTEAILDKTKAYQVDIDWNKVHQVADDQNGLPTEIGTLIH